MSAEEKVVPICTSVPSRGIFTVPLGCARAGLLAPVCGEPGAMRQARTEEQIRTKGQTRKEDQPKVKSEIYISIL